MNVSERQRAAFGAPPKQSKGFATGTPANNENPRADADERAKELGVELEPGPGPTRLFDGSDYQPARFVITPPIVNPPPANMSVQAQFAAKLAEANERVAQREHELEEAKEALGAARSARAEQPDSPTTLAELQRCITLVGVATEDLSICIGARDKLKAKIAGAQNAIQEFEASARAAAPEGMKAALPLAAAEAIGANLVALAKAVEPIVAAVLRNRTNAEHLADELGIAYRDRGADVPMAMLMIGQAIQKGWREAGGRGSLKAWIGP